MPHELWGYPVNTTNKVPGLGALVLAGKATRNQGERTVATDHVWPSSTWNAAGEIHNFSFYLII